MCQMFCELDAQQCRSEYSIRGMMLKRHTFKEIKTANWLKCLQKCNDDFRCQSFNYVITRGICELNNRTREARPEDFVTEGDHIYIKRFDERVPLGSIPTLPAGSCAEIKLSEGENAVSGNYWFDSIKPGQVVQTPCNMSTVDADECNASLPICDVNAECHNTVGSFICACKPGFSGDGFTCSDIDECTSGANNCISGRATCSNTVGSYNCTCNHGYTGDGKTSCLPQECQKYQTLSNGDRKNTYSAGLFTCDSSLGPAWFRFEGAAGTEMATSCVPINRCGTHAPGWLNGAHPTLAEGVVIRRVCFNYYSNCCQWAINIQVQNCSDFFIYYISGTPPEHTCHLRYCGAD
ncbi:hypothetical protein ACROYT_G029852 [Oculina patagonica]